MNNTSLKKYVIINFISKYINIFIQIFYSAILARILTPDDFGVVAVIIVFTTFFMLFADMGIGAAVIQNKFLTRDDLNSIFSFTFYLAFLLAILFDIFSIPLSIFYKNNVYIPIGIVLSASLFFNTINMIPNAILLKNKEFRLIGYRTIIVTLLSSVFTIILALLGIKYFAIILNSVITAFFTFLWNFKSVQLNFKFKINKNSILKIKDFSSFQFAFSVINYFSRNLDNLLIGKFIGSTALAYYDKAYKLMLYPVGNLTHVITPILQPILSDYQDNKKYIYDQYMKVVKILSLLGLFICAYCFFAAEEIILIMFGDQWYNSVVSFKILSLSVWAQIITSSTGAIFQSLGNTRLLFITGTINSLISIITIIIGISLKNITWVSASVAIAFNLHFIIAFVILIKYGFCYKYLDFIKNIIPDFIVFLICIAGLNFTSYIKFDNAVWSAIFKLIFGILFYAIGLCITKQYKVFINLLKNK